MRHYTRVNGRFELSSPRVPLTPEFNSRCSQRVRRSVWFQNARSGQKSPPVLPTVSCSLVQVRPFEWSGLKSLIRFSGDLFHLKVHRELKPGGCVELVSRTNVGLAVVGLSPDRLCPPKVNKRSPAASSNESVLTLPGWGFNPTTGFPPAKTLLY